MGLFSPVWMTKKIAKDKEAVEAVRKITDNRKLMKIAIEAPRSPVAYEALSRIDDDEILFEFAKINDGLSNRHGAISIKTLARKKIKSQELLKKLLETTDYNFVDAPIIYERIDNPPLDWNIRMSGKKAEKHLAEDVAGLAYPQDLAVLKDIIEHAVTDRGRQLAVEKLPYDSEKEYLESLLLSDNSDSFLKKCIAQKLPEGSELLKQKVCPYCGAVNSIHSFDEYRQNIDMFIGGYRCKKCRHEVSRPRGQDGAADFSLTLAQYIGR